MNESLVLLVNRSKDTSFLKFLKKLVRECELCLIVAIGKTGEKKERGKKARYRSPNRRPWNCCSSDKSNKNESLYYQLYYQKAFRARRLLDEPDISKNMEKYRVWRTFKRHSGRVSTYPAVYFPGKNASNFSSRDFQWGGLGRRWWNR